MDRYDPDFVPNGSDDGGRYDYKGQPTICRFNCSKLAEALAPVLPQAAALQVLEDTYDVEYER